MNVLSLFAGIGAFDLGMERAGFRTVAFCECDPFKQQILAQHWPEVPIYDDVRTLTAARLVDDGIVADIITGGFPCQDISIAGRGAGIGGTKSGLWFDFARLIGEIRPRFAVIENSPKLRSRGLGALLRSLVEIGYDAEWDCIPASYVGAPHRRDRIWILAYRQGDPFCADTYRLRLHQAAMHLRGDVELFNQQVGDAGSLVGWRSAPPLQRVVDGDPTRLDKARIRAIGEAVVPLIPQIIGEALKEAA